MFGAIYRTDCDSGPSSQHCLAGSQSDPAEGTAPETLAAVAREFSPRIEACGPREITLDLIGLERLFGDHKVH